MSSSSDPFVHGAKSTNDPFLSQWRKVSLAFALAFEHARTNRLSLRYDDTRFYDAFVRARPDTLYLVAHDLAADHLKMSTMAMSYARRRQETMAEYIATQHCLAAPELPVPDAWLVATPRAAKALAELPRASEPSCCEHWVKQRLLGMGTTELPAHEQSEAEAPPRACARANSKLTLSQPRNKEAQFLLLHTPLRSVFTSGRCSLPKLKEKKRLSDDSPSCIAAAGPAAKPENLAATVALQPADTVPQSQREELLDGGPAAQQALQRLLEHNSTTYFRMNKILRQSACRCSRGAAMMPWTVRYMHT